MKDGPRPATVYFGDVYLSVPAEVVMDIIDPTGAGDGFNGAYPAARMQCRSPLDATAIAHEVAGIAVQHRGALAPSDLLTKITSYRRPPSSSA